jgi:tetratricopeptide (TPR) repeat protein
MDADMILEINNFDKKTLVDDSFHIAQGSDEFFYNNMRIVRNNGLYKYMGVTHEYIDVPPNNTTAQLKKENIFIRDIGDGGAKSDKTERDIRLLTKGIEEDPNNGRYYFYLANSYHDCGKYEEGIDTYKKRIALGGWDQEIWYSYYRIGICYKKMNKISEAIYYWLEGYNYLPDRVENLYEIVNHYRDINKCKTALIFYDIAKKTIDKKLDISNYLFLHNDIYTYKLDYEYCIFSFYNNVKNIDSQAVNVFNNSNEHHLVTNLLSNMKFYKNILTPIHKIDMTFTINHTLNNNDIKFNSSSSCIIPSPSGDGYIMNIRLVNYNIDSGGYYHDCDKHIISINKYVAMTKDFDVIYEKLIPVEYVDRQYIGIEDVRFVKNKDNTLSFIGTGYHLNNTIGVVKGVYDITQPTLKPIEIKPSFKDSDCEKNWVFVNYQNEQHIIYNWHPMQICKIDDSTNLLNVVKTNKNVPKIFKYVRGSTCGVEYKNEIWFIGHIVSYESPRHYYNIFMVFDKNMELLRYSAPFKFDSECIEYCLGLIVENNRVIATYSSWDRTTIIAIYNKSYIDGLLLYT